MSKVVRTITALLELLTDPAGGLDAVEGGHADVHHDDVGAVSTCCVDRVEPVARLGHDLQVLGRLQERADRLADERLVVSQDDADHADIARLATGRVACTTQRPSRGPQYS